MALFARSLTVNGKLRKSDVATEVVDLLDAEFEPDLEQDQTQIDNIWHQHLLFLFDDHPDEFGAVERNASSNVQVSIIRKRALNETSWIEASNSLARLDSQGSDDSIGGDDLIREFFPELFASLPRPEHRSFDPDSINPFAEGSIARYSSRSGPSFKLPEHGAVNGYIKLRLCAADHIDDEDDRHLSTIFSSRSVAVHHRQNMQSPLILGEPSITAVPPDFGSATKLDATDQKLWKFYTGPLCNGRTLMSETNFWLVDIAPLADNNECVKHALLASTAAYVLDYIPREALQRRANYHYRRAVDLLSKALRDHAAQEVGKEDTIIAALLLLSCDDLINWELQKKGAVSKWQQGNRLAKRIPDNADPGYKHWSPINVQSSKARITLANRIAFIDILAQPVSPLVVRKNDRMYGWLIEGTNKEMTQIHGGTGLCSQLLHTFAQITHLSSLMAETPNSPIIPHGAAKIDQILGKLHQWSELSPGYASTEELFASCKLDAEGKVSTKTKVTELTGEAWRYAAQIYLQCRFYRKPHTHPDVLANLDVLVNCIRLMPYTGPLFTSQMPFFPVFLIGIVAYRDERRQVARDWFDVVVSGQVVVLASPQSGKPCRRCGNGWIWNWMIRFMRMTCESASGLRGGRLWLQDLLRRRGY